MVEMVDTVPGSGGAKTPPGFGPVATVKEFNWDQHGELIANLTKNLTRGLETVHVKPAHDRRMLIVGGGPSLKTNLEDVKSLGGEIVAMNNAALYLRDNGIKPWGNMWWEMAWNRAAEVKEVIPGMKYLLASHSNPYTYDAVPDDSILIWHCYAGANEEDVIARYDQGAPIICGGNSGILRTINIGYILGYRKFDLFGMDSSAEDETHVYDEESSTDWIDAIFNGKVYRTLPSWAGQAHDFWLQMRNYGKEVEIAVWGEGLVPDMARKLGIHAEQLREK